MTLRTHRIVPGVGLLPLLVLPAFLWHDCGDTARPTGAGEEGPDGVTSDVGLRGSTGVSVTYSPDGVHTCSAGMGPVYLPVGLGLVVLAFSR